MAKIKATTEKKVKKATKKASTKKIKTNEFIFDNFEKFCLLSEDYADFMNSEKISKDNKIDLEDEKIIQGMRFGILSSWTLLLIYLIKQDGTINKEASEKLFELKLEEV